MRTTGGFRVPDDGEIRLTMTYPGRGQDVRVLQSTEFRSWNVVGGDFTISAMLVSTKDEPLSEATTVQVKQERGAHFVLMQPLDGQLLLSRAAVPVVVLFGGAVPPGSRVCFDVTSAPPRGSAAAPHHVSVCTDDPGLDMTEDQGTLRVNIAVPAGNCTLRAGVYDADRQSLTPEAVRSFRVVDEQDECPSGSGVACLHGECQHGKCVCDSADHIGRRCAPAPDTSQHQTSRAIASLKTGGGSERISDSSSPGTLAATYLHLIKAALLDSLYAKDRAGETQVVARSMVGLQGLSDLQTFVEVILGQEVEGDLVETGVWQGGSCILMAAVLRANNDRKRKVWVMDSFEGCPEPDAESFPQDANDKHHTFKNLQVSVHKVTSNFADFGLESDQIELVRGWFHDSVFSDRVQAIEKLALLRLDGDLYQSTIEVLRGLYYKVAVGGFVVVDDWRLDGMQARSAVIDFHRECEIQETIHVGQDGLAWWRKLQPSACG
eukprot:Tamp_06409.p1 GENE.Tamp_06409~~Tamp_06409.p1  ORF type:complete len:492 (+),score=79.04 Tamp_06409:1203-2678(+)